MAVTLLRVLVLGVIAAAADDVPITWWGASRVALPCVVPNADKIIIRRPPPLLEDERQARPKPYTWTKDHEELRSKVSKNGTLEVSRKDSSEGVYQCAVKFHAGKVLGNPINLKFAYLSKQFSTRPENVTVLAGQPVVLNCTISSGPPADITWIKDGEPLPANRRYHILKNHLLILDATKEDAGYYRCRASNHLANKTRQSFRGLLKVEDARDTNLSFLPLQQDRNIAVPLGDEVVLACPVAGWPRSKLSWFYTSGESTLEFDNEAEVHTVRTFSNELGFNPEGSYSCSVNGRPDLSKTFNITITEPVIITIPPASKTIGQANTVRFNCTAVGRPEPTITWYKDGAPLILENRIFIRSSTDGQRKELLIRSLTSNDAGVYQCVAKNSVSTVSSWATLNVSGVAAPAPQGVACAPVGLHNISIRWDNITDAFASAIFITALGGNSLPSVPVLGTNVGFVPVSDPFLPHYFQVRAFLKKTPTSKTEVTHMSANVTCYGQGVPINITRSKTDVTVSWKQFTDLNPGVKQWILQYKVENTSSVTNLTLGPEVYKYTIKGVSPEKLQVRLLGTKQIPWLYQNLTLVEWRPSKTAHNFQDGLTAIPENLMVLNLGPTYFTVAWQCRDVEKFPEVSYLVCVTDEHDIQQCFESFITSYDVANLTQNTKYEVRVQAQISSINLKGKFSDPITVDTLSNGPQQYKDLTYKLVNATSLRVSWNSFPDKYTIYYTNDLTILPVTQWPSIEAFGNTVLLTDLDLTKNLYVMVKVAGQEPLGRSPILRVPPQLDPVQSLEPDDTKYSYIPGGIQLSWEDARPRKVQYSQDLAQWLEKWDTVLVNGTSVELTGLSPEETFIAVSVDTSPTRMLTIPAPPPTPPKTKNETNNFYLWVGVIGGSLVLCQVLFTGLYLWKRRKQARSPIRARRRDDSPSQENDEENAEMKTVGGRLANGGTSKDAGEPLLNGHVNITENPSSKTPNGRMRKSRRYDASFDVARYEDPDTTLETVLDDSGTTFSLLDTSRVPEYDLTRSHLPNNDSYNKFPDDNMNSELRSTSQIDDGKILPTLQPNG